MKTNLKRTKLDKSMPAKQQPVYGLVVECWMCRATITIYEDEINKQKCCSDRCRLDKHEHYN